MKPILIGAAPNIEADDVFVALKQLFSPWSWKTGRSLGEFRSKLAPFFREDSRIYTFDSARSALLVILRSMKLKPGDEVILPAFICYVVANAVIKSGAKPVYADVDVNYNLSIDSVKTLISKKTKAIIVPHMFGVLVDIGELKQNLPKDVRIIEDLAHSFGSEVSSHSDAAIVSFGMDKVISTTRGGALATADPVLIAQVESLYKKINHLQAMQIFRLLFSPIMWWLLTPLYYVGFGKFTIGKLGIMLATKLGLAGSITVYAGEDQAVWPSNIPARLSNGAASLGLNQIKKIEKLREHRAKVAQVYSKETNKISYLRYPVQVEDRDCLISEAKELKVILGKWYDSVLFVEPEQLAKYGYVEGSAPNAERLSKAVLNLPTSVNVSTRDAEKLAILVKDYVAS